MTWLDYLQEAVSTEINCRVFSAFNANVDMVITVRPGGRGQDLRGLSRAPPDKSTGARREALLLLPASSLRSWKSAWRLENLTTTWSKRNWGEWFLEYFEEHTEARGGQAGIIANQMAALGAQASCLQSCAVKTPG